MELTVSMEVNPAFLPADLKCANAFLSASIDAMVFNDGVLIRFWAYKSFSAVAVNNVIPRIFESGLSYWSFILDLIYPHHVSRFPVASFSKRYPISCHNAVAVHVAMK